MPDFRRISFANHAERLALSTALDHERLAVRDPLNEQRNRLSLVFAMLDHLLRGGGVGHRKSVDAEDSVSDVERIVEVGMIALLPSGNPYLLVERIEGKSK